MPLSAINEQGVEFDRVVFSRTARATWTRGLPRRSAPDRVPPGAVVDAWTSIVDSVNRRKIG